ncbi:MAG TPA: hypothetical protein VFB73_04755 [Chloroflexota bacterium]|nr:hypothetical protein [Chloroflexota bacterium]
MADDITTWRLPDVGGIIVYIAKPGELGTLNPAVFKHFPSFEMFEAALDRLAVWVTLEDGTEACVLPEEAFDDEEGDDDGG